MAVLTAKNLMAESQFRNNIEAARDGQHFDILGHDPADLCRAETLERLDAENTPYSLMRQRAIRAEQERDDALAEIERLRAMIPRKDDRPWQDATTSPTFYEDHF